MKHQWLNLDLAFCISFSRTPVCGMRQRQSPSTRVSGETRGAAPCVQPFGYFLSFELDLIGSAFQLGNCPQERWIGRNGGMAALGSIRKPCTFPSIDWSSKARLGRKQRPEECVCVVTITQVARSIGMLLTCRNRSQMPLAVIWLQTPGARARDV